MMVADPSETGSVFHSFFIALSQRVSTLLIFSGFSTLLAAKVFFNHKTRDSVAIAASFFIFQNQNEPKRRVFHYFKKNEPPAVCVMKHNTESRRPVQNNLRFVSSFTQGPIIFK